MVRVREAQLRPVKIFRLEGSQRFEIATVMALNLSDGIRRFYEEYHEDARLRDPHFQANTMTARVAGGEDETYVATD